MSGGKSEIMASMSRGAPPRQREKAKLCVLDLGLDVLDLEGNSLWGIIAANRIKKKSVRNLNFTSRNEDNGVKRRDLRR